jgi:hypothetical protein
LVELKSSLVSGYARFKNLAQSLSGLSASASTVTPWATDEMRLAALPRWAGPVHLGLAMVGRIWSLPRCPPHIAHVGVNSMSRPCPGPASLLASQSPALACHSLIAAHVLVCPLCARRPTTLALGSQLESDPSTDSFPPTTMAVGSCYFVVAWWSHLGPIRLARRFTGQCPSHPSPPRLASHATELQFGVCSAPGH